MLLCYSQNAITTITFFIFLLLTYLFIYLSNYQMSEVSAGEVNHLWLLKLETTLTSKPIWIIKSEITNININA